MWQIDVFHFAEFVQLKHGHHTIDSGIQWATALNSKKVDSIIKHLLEVIVNMGIPVQMSLAKSKCFAIITWRILQVCHTTVQDKQL